MKELGDGFTPTNLRYRRQLYTYFPIYHTVCDKLSWSHYRSLLKIQEETIRNFYVQECIKENWSVRQLQRQINTMFYEKLLASRDKETVRAEIAKTASQTLAPKEIIRDPYTLEFLGFSQRQHFLENDLEEALINRLQYFLLEADVNVRQLLYPGTYESGG